MRYYELSGEQKIDAIEKIASIENETYDKIEEQIYQGFNPDENYSFIKIDDNSVRVNEI